MALRVIAFVILGACCASTSYAKVGSYRDYKNSRMEDFARAYSFCKVIIADNPHINPTSAIKTDELAECAVDISLRELGRRTEDDYVCLRSIGDEWTEFLDLLRDKKVSDTGIALHLRSFISNYVDKCNLEAGRGD